MYVYVCIYIYIERERERRAPGWSLAPPRLCASCAQFTKGKYTII